MSACCITTRLRAMDRDLLFCKTNGLVENTMFYGLNIICHVEQKSEAIVAAWASIETRA
jgi:hypothetical protein